MPTAKEKQFLKVLEDHQQRIHKLCSMYATSREDQQDLVQEVVLNIWKSFASFRGEAAIGTWIYRIILNVCLKKRYAIANRQTVISLENLTYEFAAAPTEERPEFVALRRCIQQLEFADRSIIILFLEELSYREIGEIIGISENYVAVKIKRIKAKLGICIKKETA